MPRSAADTEAAILSLQAQCMLLGDNVVDAAVQALRAEAAAMGAAALAQSQTQAQMHAHTHTQAHTQAHANAPAAPAPQLRQVSVLFLDIVGSTRLSQSLAPEDIQDVMDGALACFTDVVQRHQGSVLQYAGDSLLAAFGAAQAREDDADAPCWPAWRCWTKAAARRNG